MTTGESVPDTSAREVLLRVARVLQETGGRLVFLDAAGERYVVAREADVDRVSSSDAAVQLSFPAVPARASADALPDTDAVLERINQEIASYYAQQHERDIADLDSGEAAGDDAAPSVPIALPQPQRVRFEPLKGDLAPELQD